MPRRQVVVPLIVLALAAALWFWRSGEEPVIELSDDALACTEQLRAIHAGLLLYATRNGGPPAGSGGAFLRALLTDGVWEDTPEHRARLLCPGNGKPYAARDQAAHPLARYPSGGAELEAVAACDGEGALPHAGCMNVLYSDGSVHTLLLEQELTRGRLAPGAKRIPVGPDSPLPDLRELAGE